METNILRKAKTLTCLILLFASNALAQFHMAAYTKAVEQAEDYYFIQSSELDETTFDQIRLLKADTPIAAGYSNLTEENNTHEVSFTFDPTLESMLLVAGAEELEEMKIIKPDGTELDPITEKFIIYAFKNQQIISGTFREAGPFKIQVKGKGHSAITVRGRLKAATVDYNIKPVTYEFGLIEEYLRYSQYVKLRRPIKPGDNIHCSLLVKTPGDEIMVEFVGAKGNVLATPELKFKSEKRSGSVFRGPCEIPMEPFRFMVYRAKDGEPMAQRLMPELIKP